MKRVVVLGLVLVAVAVIVLGNGNISKNAETLPPNPTGIVAFYK